MTPRWRTVERRFVVDVGLAGEILSWARAELDPDPHGTGAHGDEYELRTIYFDSPSFDVLRRLGSNGRAKYRIRRYNDEEWVFLERKLRTRALLAKRRSAVPIDMVAALASEEGSPPQWRPGSPSDLIRGGCNRCVSSATNASHDRLMGRPASRA